MNWIPRSQTSHISTLFIIYLPGGFVKKFIMKFMGLII